MPEETEEQSEMDNGFDSAWISGVVCKLGSLRQRSKAWIVGYNFGRRTREEGREWGGQGAVPPFCPLKDLPSLHRRSRSHG